MEKYSELFFEKVIIKNGDNPRITNLADSTLNFFTRNKLFLIELRRNATSKKKYQYYKKTMDIYSKLILHFLNIHDDYPIKEVNIYSEIIINSILDICYQYVIDKSITKKTEAKIMLEDFMKRFFNCDEDFFY